MSRQVKLFRNGCVFVASKTNQLLTVHAGSAAAAGGVILGWKGTFLRGGFSGLAIAGCAASALLAGASGVLAEAQDRVVASLPTAPEPAAPANWQPVEPKLLKFDPTKVDISVGVSAQLLATRTTDSTTVLGTQSIFQEETQGTSPSAGVAVSFHQQFRGWLGYDINYGYTQTDVEHSVGTISNGSGGISQTFQKSSTRVDMTELSLGYVVKAPTSSHRLQTFFEVGPGGLFYHAPQTQYGDYAGRKLALLFGVGSDLRLTDHLGLRIEYRGLLTRTVDSELTVLPTQSVSTVISEPTISLKYTFGAHKRMQ